MDIENQKRFYTAKELRSIEKRYENVDPEDEEDMDRELTDFEQDLMKQFE